MRAFSCLVLSKFCVLGLVTVAMAQDHKSITFKQPAANTKYLQQINLDVGDAPGHQVRLYDVRRTFPTDPPIINGVKLLEMSLRGTSDNVDANGASTTYIIYMMEGGDKFFSHGTSALSTLAGVDGSRKSVSNGAFTITGGTGRFAGIRGFMRTVSIVDLKAGINDGEAEMEYWFAN
jgi:hypothetical protein